jgi:hypothetical protein
VSEVDPLDAAELSAALIVWTGWGQTPWPQLRKLEDDFYATDARLVDPDLETMARIAADEFRRLHPEISDDAVQALTWCYTWDYK